MILMQLFCEAIVLTIEPHIDAIHSLHIKAKLVHVVRTIALGKTHKSVVDEFYSQFEYITRHVIHISAASALIQFHSHSICADKSPRNYFSRPCSTPDSHLPKTVSIMYDM